MRLRLDIIHWPLWLSLIGIVGANLGFGDGAMRIAAMLLFLLPLTLFAYLLMRYLFAPAESRRHDRSSAALAPDAGRQTTL
ncbi:MAG: hypothetical protein HKN78_02780 [Sphingomonadaceae bacterium]|nr:hypothetical protein [Sphingomonadaceae bacterium]